MATRLQLGEARFDALDVGGEAGRHIGRLWPQAYKLSESAVFEVEDGLGYFYDGRNSVAFASTLRGRAGARGPHRATGRPASRSKT
jgi:hypothetical protein